MATSISWVVYLVYMWFVDVMVGPLLNFGISLISSVMPVSKGPLNSPSVICMITCCFLFFRLLQLTLGSELLLSFCSMIGLSSLLGIIRIIPLRLCFCGCSEISQHLKHNRLPVWLGRITLFSTIALVRKLYLRGA